MGLSITTPICAIHNGVEDLMGQSIHSSIVSESFPER